MIERLLFWFRGRSRREQYLLAGAAALAFLTLVYGVLAFGDALAAAKSRHADAVIALGETQARVDAVKAAQIGRAVALDAPLEAVIRARANDAGFALTNVSSQGTDRVQIMIASARPGALVAWIADLEAAGILVDRLGTTDNGDRTVAAQITLKAQGI